MSMNKVEATIAISPYFGQQRWDRMILGHFIEHFHTQIYGGIYEPGSPLANSDGFRTDVIDAMKELRVPIMRWPGGNYVSDHHWYEAVGPERVPSYNKAWRVVEPNTFGTDEFLKWCKAVGCEPYLCTNAGNGTPEEMSNWVEYCNGHLDTRHARQRRSNGNDAPFNVKYWGIGNECYGAWQIGAKTVAEWGSYVAESAKMMRRVDENIVLSAAAVPDTEWTSALLRTAGRHLDLISIHGYWDYLAQKDEPKDYMACMSETTSPDAMIRQTRSVIDAAGLMGKIKIAFDEWNLRGWHHPNGNAHEKIQARDRNDRPETYTMADAIFSSCFLNACLRNADLVVMANVAPGVNTRGPLFVHREGILKRTTYHVLKLYGDKLRDSIVASATRSTKLADEATPAVDAVASADSTGMTIFVVNRHPEHEARCRIVHSDIPLEAEFEATVLTADSPDAYNDLTSPIRVNPRSEKLKLKDGLVTIRPHSLTVLSTTSGNLRD